MKPRNSILNNPLDEERKYLIEVLGEALVDIPIYSLTQHNNLQEQGCEKCRINLQL